MFIVLLLSFVCLTANAQTSSCDSLLNLVKGAEGGEKYGLLVQISKISPNLEQGVEYANRAIELAASIDVQTLVNAQLNLAQIYSDAYDDVNALKKYHLALETSAKNSYTDGLLAAIDGVMRSYFYLDSIDKTKQYAAMLLSEADKNGNLKYKSSAFLQMARVQQADGNVDSSLALTNKALELRLTIGNKSDIAQTYKFLGQIYYNDARFEQAVECYNKEVEIKEEISYEPRYLAIAYQNLGNTHFAIGNYQLALEKIQKALTLFEKDHVDDGIAICCTGIGDIYQNLSQSELATVQNRTNLNKALEYYDRALKIFKNLNNIDYQGVVLQSIGTVYSRLVTNGYVEQFGEEWEDSIFLLKKESIKNNFSIALSYYNQALEIYDAQENGRKPIRDIVNVNSNIGSINNWSRNWSEARKYITRAIYLANKNDLPLEKTSAYYALGENLMKSGQLEQAEATFLQCVALSKELGIKETLRYCYLRLSQIYEQVQNPQKALIFYKNAVEIKDKIYTEKSQRSITEMQTKYETDKKEQENKLLRNQKDLADAVIQRQRLMIIGAVVGVVLVLMVALLMFKMFRNKQRANRILEEKNMLITEQKKQITDSIRYASSIQGAVLPSTVLFNELLHQDSYFVLFMPKDIVSGDFYWITRMGTKVVLAAADCTGHGVPGAFMSMLGISFLYEIVNKDGVLKPSDILNNLRNLIKTTLGQRGDLSDQKDGMDMSLCVIDQDNMQLEWAGAYNPLYRVRNGELTEYTADKMPVAVHIRDYLPFTNHTIELQKGDTFYIFSDGYSDQFGGQEGRKFLSKRFKALVVGMNAQSMLQQRETLLQEHHRWRGDTEQIDDILVIGFRV